MVQMENVEENDDLIHSAYADRLGYSYFILFFLGIFLLAVFFGSWSIGSILLMLVLILAGVLTTMFQKKMFFYKSYILIKHPFNPFKDNVRINKSDIINVSIPPWSWGKTSNSIVFQTKDKKIPYVTFDLRLLEKLHQNYKAIT